MGQAVVHSMVFDDGSEFRKLRGRVAEFCRYVASNKVTPDQRRALVANINVLLGSKLGSEPDSKFDRFTSKNIGGAAEIMTYAIIILCGCDNRPDKLDEFDEFLIVLAQMDRCDALKNYRNREYCKERPIVKLFQAAVSVVERLRQFPARQTAMSLLQWAFPPKTHAL